MNGITVIVPAPNEAGTIHRLVVDLMKTLPVEVIVVDNDSTDGTAAEARSAGARVVSEPRRGYGDACSAGVSATSEAEILVFIDADYSFLPAELPLILAPILKGKADLVLDSRKFGWREFGPCPSTSVLGTGWRRAW